MLTAARQSGTSLTMSPRLHMPSLAGATGWQTSEITFLAPGTEAYAFTFG